MIIRRIPASPGWLHQPLGELERLQRDMGRLFDALTGESNQEASTGMFPPLNLTQNDNCFYVRAEIPGVKVKDLQISALPKRFIISGERKLAEEEAAASYHRRERSGGVFNRSITLPSAIDPEKVVANCTNGVLMVTLPKAEESRPRQISIESA